MFFAAILIQGFPVHGETYRLWLGERTELRKVYETALVKLALETTRDTHGDYALEFDMGNYSIARRYQEFGKDNVVNATINPVHPAALDKEIIIPIALMEGLLGVRKLVARQATLPDIATVRTPLQLRQFSVGQGFQWTEVEIYRGNGFDVVEADFALLFSMLAKKRFDLLPLGLVEIGPDILANMQLNPNLALVDEVLIYYPLPVLLQVDKAKKAGANRLSIGIHKLQENGQIKRLFTEHFGKFYDEFFNAPGRIIELNNPQLPDGYLTTLEKTAVTQFLRGNRGETLVSPRN